MLILHNMRKCVLILLIAFSCAGLHSCAEGAAGVSQEAPELLKAVPSDALCVGLFGRLDHGMEQMIDSLSALRSLDYGKLSRSRAELESLWTLRRAAYLKAAEVCIDNNGPLEDTIAQLLAYVD